MTKQTPKQMTVAWKPGSYRGASSLVSIHKFSARVLYVRLNPIRGVHLRIKCKRTNDISQRVPDERPCSHRRLLCVPGHVGRSHGDTLNPGRGKEIDEIESDDASGALGGGKLPSDSENLVSDQVIFPVSTLKDTYIKQLPSITGTHAPLKT